MTLARLLGLHGIVRIRTVLPFTPELPVDPQGNRDDQKSIGYYGSLSTPKVERRENGVRGKLEHQTRADPSAGLHDLTSLQ